MLVGLKPSSKIAVNPGDNLCRWDGSSPHYEVWFLTLNHRLAKTGFWFRYTIECPSHANDGPGPRAALWAAFFDRERIDRGFGLIREWPIDQFLVEGDARFRLNIGDGLLSGNHAVGRIAGADHSIAWDLSYVPNETTYHHVSRAVAALSRPSSFVCSPNLDTRFTGVISVDGREFSLEDEPGCQSHTWGRKHVDDWVWVHSNAFERSPGTVFEGLAGRQRKLGRKLPPIQSLLLRHRGVEHRFTRLRMAEQWQRKLGMGYWSFAATNTRVHIEGVAQCRLRDMVQAEYADPDGESLYCINSEVANLKIRLFRRTRGIRFRHVETINSLGAAHLEHASRSRDSDVTAGFFKVCSV
ncbi:MAG TPA: tocopherol cyclase family protein [Blastocatellia bacterium]|nr:tocopherol cyclase family protein [Blastocatellia bacterium]